MANVMNQTSEDIVEELERTKWKRIGLTLLKDWRLYALLIPMLVFLIMFRYLPIYGILQAFKYGDTGTVMEYDWYGLRYLKMLLTGNKSTEFFQAFRNTFVNSMYGLIFGFPIPILLALLFSEVKNQSYRSFLQVCSYLPKFISTVVVTTIIIRWCYIGDPDHGFAPGLLAQLFYSLGWANSGTSGGMAEYIVNSPRYFRPIYQISGIWEGAGYGSIVYFAAIMAISPTNYEAAKIDGANKMQQIRYVTLPGMAPTLSIMLIMRIGQILNIGYEKIILLWQGDGANSMKETSDVISTFVYRYRSSGGGMQSVAVAADLFNSIISMCLVLGANAISRRVSDTSLF